MASSRTHVETIAKRVLISGKVQGVGYRYALAELARLLNVQGWCRNLKDGRVEALLQGTQPAIDEILEWLHKGTTESTVEAVSVEDQAVLEPMLGENIQTFEIRK